MFHDAREPLIPLQRSVVVAADIHPVKLPELIEGTAAVEGIGAYKVGFRLGIRGLDKAVAEIRRYTMKPIIFDGQKFGTDIPELGPDFTADLKECGVDAVIIFPFTGMRTQTAWTEAAIKNGLMVLIGGEMTHPGFLRGEGGYFTREDANVMYSLGVGMGVRDFVVPGNKPDSVGHFRKFIQGWLKLLGKENEQFRFYAPSFISQGGDISETGKVAGDSWHAIVGSALYKQDGVEAVRAAAQKLTAQITA